jgi:hypothetical protein
MIWLLNGETIAKGIEPRIKKANNIITFRWKFPPKSWWSANEKIYIDLPYSDVQILLIKKIYKKVSCYGYGMILTKEEFLKQYG